MRASWTDERIDILKNLVLEGKNIKEIAEIMDLRTEQVRQAKIRFITKDNNKILVDEIEPDKCFADSSDGCSALQQKECKGCNFFKNQKQARLGREKVLRRIMSLDSKTRNRIEALYELEYRR